MRYPDGHKEAVRERIVTAASEALRRHGVAGVSIPTLMKQAGLTHGGFYSHFEDRDELVADAVRAAGEATAETTLADDLTLEQSVARYLSEPHLEHPEQGCVLAALGPDGPRQSPVVRQAFAEVARGFVAIIDRKLRPSSKAKQLSDEALVHAATMIGAIVLGRLLDEATAKRLLAAAKKSTTET